MPIGSGADSTVVNISSDGSHVYFVSPAQLDGDSGQAGADNLYVWDESAVRFIATLDPLDVVGHEGKPGNGGKAGGLGLWTTYVTSSNPDRQRGPAADPSRSTRDGSILVFESHADLTGYRSGGHSEVFRFDAAVGAKEALLCVSCNPTGSPAIDDAQLESEAGASFEPFPPVNALSHIDNLSAGGGRVFFQSTDRLVPGDVDGKIDIYEWESDGVGACIAPHGCIYLISSGHSATDDYLYAVSAAGQDVFFQSSDLLAGGDADGTPSIYDARVDGGFVPGGQSRACRAGDECRPEPFAPASLISGASAVAREPRRVTDLCRKVGARHRRSRIRCGKHRHRKRHRHHRHRRRHHTRIGSAR